MDTIYTDFAKAFVELLLFALRDIRRPLGSNIGALSRCTINNISWSFCCSLCATFAVRLALISARSSELRSHHLAPLSQSTYLEHRLESYSS